MLVDSHCHLNRLDLTPYNGNLDQALKYAREQGVSLFLTVCVELSEVSELQALAEQYDDVYFSVGQHPNDAIDEEPDADTLIQLAQHPKTIAIGETGLDYFRSEGDLTWQRDRFRVHIAAAKQINKPLIIHTRDAMEDTLKMMREEGVIDCGGVMHCFCGTWEEAQAAMDLGFYISIPGIVTFKNATQVQEVASKVPLEKLLVETDSPYLAPVPFRGKPNEPGYVRHTAERIAELRGEPFEFIAEQTTKNFNQLFFSF